MKNLGVRAESCGHNQPVLEAQVDRGFAFVEEGACELLLLSKGKSLPDGSETEYDRKTLLTMHCISAIKPDLDTEAVSKAINKAYLLENPDCYANVQVDADALGDVLDKGETKKMAEYFAQVEKTKARKNVVMETKEQHAPKLFKVTPAPKYLPKEKKTPRWLPEKDATKTEKIHEWIKKHISSNISVQVDDYNGRWRVIAPTDDWKSISWTKRGHKKAAMEVIHQAWVYENDFTGQKPPFSLDDLAATFVE